MPSGIVWTGASERAPPRRAPRPAALIDGARNTIVFEHDPAARAAFTDRFTTGHSPESGSESLRQLLCWLPTVQVRFGIGYRDLFRVLIVEFQDAYNFDLRTVKRSCIHIVQPDGRIIPFDTFNLFYRDERAAHLARLRTGVEAGLGGGLAACPH